MKVRALRQGIYQGRHIDPGTIFDIDEKMFSDAHHPKPEMAQFGWMEKVEDKTALSSDANITKGSKKKSLLSRVLGG